MRTIPPCGACQTPSPLVFISYSRENREVAERVAHALNELAIDVWWDRDLPGGSAFAEVLEQRLAEAHVVIVLWSDASIRSGFVRDESTRALQAGKLLPVRIEEVVPPLGFGQLHALDLFDWDGAHDDPAFAAVSDEVRRRFGQPLVARSAARPSRTRWRRRGVLAGVVALLALLAAIGGWQAWLSVESRRNLRLGLEEQFGREPNLQAARNYYLDALGHRPDNARARYYIGHVYAQLGELDLARTSFERAVRDREGLDDAQLADAVARVKAMAHRDEPDAVARSVAPAPPSSTSAATTGTTIGTTIGTTSSTGAIIGKATGTTAAATTAASSAAASTGTTTGAPTVARLPHGSTPASVRDPASALVGQMFGDDSENRIAATTTLVTDPDLLSDAVPLAVERALELLDAAGGKPSIAVQSGVVNTLVLLQSALPGTLTVHHADIERLLQRAGSIGQHTASLVDKVRARLARAPTERPVAFIQIANEAQRPIAEALAVRLRAAGYDTPAIELVGARAPATGAIRVQGRSDRGLARWLARVAGEAGGESMTVQTLRNVNPHTDTFEIWFDRDLCTPGHMAAKCAA